MKIILSAFSECRLFSLQMCIIGNLLFILNFFLAFKTLFIAVFKDHGNIGESTEIFLITSVTYNQAHSAFVAVDNLTLF